MSDNWIVVVPEDAAFVPDATKQLQGRDRFAAILQNVDEIRIEVLETIRFFDCGANFERVRCPSCHREIPLDWWQDRMDDEFKIGFALADYAAPCCNTSHTLQELIYEWPQGFGRFALKARNPKVAMLDKPQQDELQGILGTALRVIYQHY